MDAEVQQLWDRWTESRDEEAREALVMEYAPIVKYVAGRVGAGLPSHVERDDLVSYGLLGLVDAIDRFDRTTGAKFAGFAIPRIRGAILDELRRIDWAPRSVRRNARRVARASSALESELGRSPTDEELAARLEIELGTLRDWLQDETVATVLALDHPHGAEATLGDTLIDLTQDTPDETVEHRDLVGRLKAQIHELPEQERTVVALYYFEGMTLKQVGEVLGLTEARICQVRGKAVASLRGKMAKEGVAA